jgi:hypothetical protein
MNWLHFFLWVAGLYALYYLLVILYDVAGTKNAPAAGTISNELTFSEKVHPVQLQHQPVSENAEGTTAKKHEREVIVSGGVSLKDLFNLARQEAIIYTNPVSY